MMKLLEPLLPSISTIHTRLQQAHNVQWLIGGSCGLLLHNVDIGRTPRDLDIYIDLKDVHTVHMLLEPYATDRPELSETSIYASILSHYNIEGHLVEVVGDFKVKALDSMYQVEVSYLRENFYSPAYVEGQEVPRMPLAHEFLFNVLRNRPDRYEPILRTMKAYPEQHMKALRELINRNQWGHEFQEKMNEMLDWNR
ncbi:nucleotidyltransferase domain-containing protein [Paenibacillus qinlingensis]|uniref:Uncharacterized protein n=1 Tax=Paenibacillus qinlingensis TaxID=1837343 RepID=A0ABU1NRE5_9BACL|nr:hypothetical protein [Paenibacillus qinlingensis]MDR6549457.1 hypothetical protein [Paenibacillus qinlingensis]